MSPRRQQVLLTVALALVVSACAGLRFSPVTAESTSNWIPGKFIWHDLITHDWLWNELWSDDQEAAAGLYAALVGYELNDAHEKLAGKPYTVFRVDGTPRAGLLVNPLPEEVTPLWLPYVRVAHPAAVVAKVEGGRCS